MASIVIEYFVQNEKKHRSPDPNLFVLPRRFKSHKDVRVRDIYKNFPLSGNYYLRFLTNSKEMTNPIWVDVKNLDAPVPTLKTRIILKATLLPPEVDRRLYSQPPRSARPAQQNGVAHSEQSRHSINTISRRQSNLLDEGAQQERQGPSTPQKPLKQKEEQSKKKPQSGDLLSLSMDVGEGGLQEDKKEEEAVPNYLAEMAKNYAKETGKVNLQRFDHYDAEKRLKEQWNKQEEEKEALHEAQHKYETNIKGWAFDDLGKLRNIRTLIETLPKILWEGAEWTPIPMAQMVSNPKVKRAYYSALRIVAPDKNQDKTYEIQYISTRIFNLLNNAWKVHEVSAELKQQNPEAEKA